MKTPVQAFVKRIDEQAFAVVNGEHNMFAEDAARILTQLFSDDETVQSFFGKVSHFESLHNHNAIAEFNSKDLI